MSSSNRKILQAFVQDGQFIENIEVRNFRQSADTPELSSTLPSINEDDENVPDEIDKPYLNLSEEQLAAERVNISERLPYARNFQLPNGNTFEAASDDPTTLAAALALFKDIENITAKAAECNAQGQRTSIFRNSDNCYRTLSGSHSPAFRSSFEVTAMHGQVTPQLVADSNRLANESSDFCRRSTLASTFAGDNSDNILPLFILVAAVVGAIYWFTRRRNYEYEALAQHDDNEHSYNPGV